ncbi:hypothetical protein [Actinoplanes sichuanensis]|uniref:Uncharacterized protein n=1 Tax=Actinoplanes sichuanensis TaxID=512349 RepID=A0ABW4A9E4_9ACTN|nr:hypothetical protein [Actinoplanes sichuanensis]
MAVERPLRIDTTGIAVAAGLAALLFGGVVQGLHLIGNASPTPRPPVTRPAETPDRTPPHYNVRPD